MNGDMIRFDAQGTHSVNGTIEGNCSFTGGLPFQVAARGTIETDGLDAQIRYQPEGTSPQIGMQCRIPGRGNGTGFSMPAPMNVSSNDPRTINLPLRDGAEQTYDMANSDVASIMNRGGVRISGQGRMRLTLECTSGD
jgi:hypothetical protein